MIELRNVSFAYEGQPALSGITALIHRGETIGIVGPTGAGKSTLLSLLLRLYDPTRGSVTMDGVDLRQLTLRSLRSSIAVVPQDTWILDGTIADNISFGHSEATEEEIRLAAETALVDEFASRFPEGYDTRVGESGARLSGGQRRRIALARALLRNAQVLLLDEPTSGLDAESEAAVSRALQRAARGRTMIIVTHRLGLAAMASRVLVLREGRISESGTVEHLIRTGGAFARMWKEQVLSSARLGPDSGMPVHSSDGTAVA
jgi:ABC-type multidrug transport system fused ATPase/permease subunit